METINLCRYGIVTLGHGEGTYITYGAMQQLFEENPGEFFVRAENSGSEGCYVEVARWNWDACRWQKFAFLKCLGGELGGDSDLNGEQTAAWIVRVLSEHVPPMMTVIFRMQSWRENEEEEDDNCDNGLCDECGRTIDV